MISFGKRPVATVRFQPRESIHNRRTVHLTNPFERKQSERYYCNPMTSKDLDAFREAVCLKIVDALEKYPGATEHLAAELNLMPTPVPDMPIIQNSHWNYRDALAEYTAAITAIQRIDYELSEWLNLDYAFEKIISHFQMHRGLQLLLSEHKPPIYKDSKWLLDPSWSEADHKTCYSRSEILLKDWLRNHVISGLPYNSVTDLHYHTMDIPSIIDMLKKAQSADTKLAIAINEVLHTDTVNSCMTLRSRIYAAKNQHERFESMMKCFPHPWEVKQTLCAVFPSIVELGLEWEFLPLIRRKIADKEDITYDDFIKIVNDRALEHEGPFYESNTEHIGDDAFYIHHKDKKRKPVIVNRTFGLDKHGQKYAKLKQQEKWLAQAFATRQRKQTTANNQTNVNLPSPRNDIIPCDECWGNWHPKDRHCIPVAARRSVVIRQLEEW